MISGNQVPTVDVLKNYIQNYGPIFTTMYSSFAAFHAYNGTSTLYYVPGQFENPDHAVLIVGWDDSLTYSKGNGQTGSGAWIVKNSWGTYWGNNGYFTIAYGSAHIGEYASFAQSWQNYDPFGKLYYYDEAGWNQSYGYPDWLTPRIAWGLAHFTFLEDRTATSVEFWMTDAGSVTISLYANFTNGNLSNLLAQKTASFNEAGYHSVKLDSPITLSKNNEVYVAVKFTNNSFFYPLAVDTLGSHQGNQSYMSYSGENGTWEDFGALIGDVTIRLRTTTPLTAPTNLLAASNSESQVDLTWMDNSPNESSFKLERSPNGTTNWLQIASVAANTQAYSDKSVFCQTPYYYRVKASNTIGDSGYSNLAPATTADCTIPLAPLGLTAQPYPYRTILLAWPDSLNETQYKIQRSLDGSTGWVPVGVVNGNITTWIDHSTLTPGVLYYYQILANNLKGDSLPSNIASASPYAHDISLPLVIR